MNTPTATKVCRACGVDKPVDEFYRHVRQRDGRATECKPCRRAARREDYHANNGIEAGRRQNWARYGLTAQDYRRRLDEQNGRCAICREEPPPGKALHVDHDHATGTTRGLLCHGCNHALGDTKDRPEVLRACADYLEQHAGAGTEEARR